MPDRQARILERLIGLHRRVDEAVAPLEREHAERLNCRLGCNQCCRDGVSVFEVEALRIRTLCAETLTKLPGPEGACAFLDSAGGCRIYQHRPYVCRTQGLPLRWYDASDHGEPVEFRDICPLNLDEDGDLPPIETLAAASCWLIGPWEGKLAHLEGQLSREEPRRILLRELFGS